MKTASQFLIVAISVSGHVHSCISSSLVLLPRCPSEVNRAKDAFHELVVDRDALYEEDESLASLLQLSLSMHARAVREGGHEIPKEAYQQQDSPELAISPGGSTEQGQSPEPRGALHRRALPLAGQTEQSIGALRIDTDGPREEDSGRVGGASGGLSPALPALLGSIALVASICVGLIDVICSPRLRSKCSDDSECEEYFTRTYDVIAPQMPAEEVKQSTTSVPSWYRITLPTGSSRSGDLLTTS